MTFFQVSMGSGSKAGEISILSKTNVRIRVIAVKYQYSLVVKYVLTGKVYNRKMEQKEKIF